MKKLKICYVTDTWFPIVGGGPQVVLNYAKILAARYNCRIDIITRRFFGQDNLISRELKDFKNIKVIRLGKRSKWNSISARLLFIVRSFVFLLKHQYDLVHAFPFIAGLPVFLAFLFNRKPLIYSVFALPSLSQKGQISPESLIQDFLTYKIPYSLIITDNYDYFTKNRQKNICYLPNGVDIRLFNQVKAKKSSFPRLLFVGRLHKQKGLAELIKSLPEIIKAIPDLKLIIIGWGQEEQNIRKLITEYRLNSSVEIKKPKFGKELIAEYKKSHYLILPSQYEGQGLVIMEAWAAGIPVISTDVGSNRFLIKNNHNGFLISVNEKDVLTKIIIQAFRKKNIVQMGQNGYMLVKKNYTWNIVVKKLYSIYQRLT